MLVLRLTGESLKSGKVTAMLTLWRMTMRVLMMVARVMGVTTTRFRTVVMVMVRTRCTMLDNSFVSPRVQHHRTEPHIRYQWREITNWAYLESSNG